MEGTVTGATVWWQLAKGKLLLIGFTQLKTDQCVFELGLETQDLSLWLHTDDGGISSTSIELTIHVVKLLGQPIGPYPALSLEGPEPLTTFTGMRITLYKDIMTLDEMM